MLVIFVFEGGFSSETIKAVNDLITTLTSVFGVERIFWLALFLFFVTLIWKIWNEKRKDKKTDLALAEKERTIQRLAAENRESRILIFKKIHGYSDEEIERFILKNVPETAEDTRNLLEMGVQSIKKVFASNEMSDKEEDKKNERN